jgi:plastocyanin
MRKSVVIFVLALPVAAFAADERTVIQKGRRFLPAEISISRAESLTFTNDDEFIHQIYNQDLFDTEERRPGQNLKEAFPHAGTFEVRCHIHPKMKLIVHVN